MQNKVATGISIPKNLKYKIDLDRGDIPRSKYILRILEKTYGKEEIGENNAPNKSRQKLQTRLPTVNDSSTSKSGSGSQVG